MKYQVQSDVQVMFEPRSPSMSVAPSSKIRCDGCTLAIRFILSVIFFSFHLAKLYLSHHR